MGQDLGLALPLFIRFFLTAALEGETRGSSVAGGSLSHVDPKTNVPTMVDVSSKQVYV